MPAGDSIKIRAARTDELEALTRLARASKAVWNYAEEHLKRWRPQLTVTPVHLRTGHVLVAEDAGALAGFATVVFEPLPAAVAPGLPREGWALEHCFVHPAFLRRGVGRALIEEVRRKLALDETRPLYIESDPNAADFYLRLGARAVGQVDSTIPGRKLPVFLLW